MKGIVFNVLEKVVGDAHGEDTWDALVETAGVDGSYTSLGSYPDAELLAIVGAASEALKLPAWDVVKWFGTAALPEFAARYQPFFEPHASTRDFLLTLNEIIHPEVRKLYPDAACPDFDFKTLPDGRLSMTYSSAKKLCAFAEGLVAGAAAHYGETVEIEQPTCMLHGGDHCVLVLTFGKAG